MTELPAKLYPDGSITVNGEEIVTREDVARLIVDAVNAYAILDIDARCARLEAAK